MPMFFFVLAGIIPLSLRNGGGAFDTVCPPPPVCKCGSTAPSAPAPPPMPWPPKYVSNRSPTFLNPAWKIPPSRGGISFQIILLSLRLCSGSGYGHPEEAGYLYLSVYQSINQDYLIYPTIFSNAWETITRQAGALSHQRSIINSSRNRHFTNCAWTFPEWVSELVGFNIPVNTL